MDDQKFEVVFVGDIAPDRELETVKGNLAGLCEIEAEDVDLLAS